MKLIRNTIMSFFGITLTIGVILLACNYAFGQQTTFLQRYSIDNTNLYYYRFNFALYVQNLQIQANRFNFNQIMPTMPDVPTFNFGDVITVGLSILAKVLMLVINWIIYILSWIILVPFKLLTYITLLIMAVFGINTGDLNRILNNIYEFNIPYLQYSWVTITT